MKRQVVITIISMNLYNLLKKEKQMLRMKEIKKCRSRKKKITLFDASESIYQKVLK